MQPPMDSSNLLNSDSTESQPTNSHAPPPKLSRLDGNEASQGEPPAKRVKLVQGSAAIQSSYHEKSNKSKRRKTKPIQPDDMLNGLAVERPEVKAGHRADMSNDSDTIEMQQMPPLQVIESSLPTEEGTIETIAKRKEKKKKKKSKDEREPGNEPTDDIPRRHKAILEKKAKSIRLAPELGLEGQEGLTMNGLGSTAVSDTSKRKTPEFELHGLEPIPQPAPVAPDSSIPMYETLPAWLAQPIRITPEASAPFTEFGLTPDLGITPEIAERLALKGYKQAFAIQTGVIPLLLPNYCKTMQGDVLVSAATGSGKTLAYTLPIIRDISQSNRHTTRLRALIVVPTRELVKQVQQVCDDCAGVFAIDGAKRRPRITMAMGSQSFDHEQTLLIEREELYDPVRYKQRMKRLAHLSGLDNEEEENGGDEDSGYNTEDEERDLINRKEDQLQTMPDHITAYKSKTDILICTPGRLVEHIKFTPGFSLDFVRWLVVDEADKLLGQNFQQWLDIVIPRLQGREPKGSRNHKQSNLSEVRKVILSATMTRDLDQLEGLKLRRPRLVILEGAKVQDDDRDTSNQTEHVLPELLEETALKVGDANLKPLFLVDLLQSRYVLDKVGVANLDRPEEDEEEEDDDDTSSSGSDSDSDLESDSAKKPTSKALGDMATVLIFTKSNETTLRLSRLLTLLAPKLEPFIGTLTSTTPYTSRRDTLRSFNAGRLRIIVASDLVARGIDLPSLDHVINYDMPSSIASYVHRVGRTARAGNAGKAWTLFTNSEARWFWNEVASQKIIRRNKPVERIRVTEEKEDAFNDKVVVYEAALQKLGQEAGEARHKNRQE